VFRIDSLSVGMRPVYRAAICHRDCVRFAQPLATTPASVFTMPIRAFTIPIRVFTMRRSWRSRSSDPRVHDRAKSAPCPRIGVRIARATTIRID